MDPTPHLRQRIRALAGLAIGLGPGLLGTRMAWASDKSDAMALAERARLTVQAFDRHPDFASMKPALARARAVLVFPQVVKAGFLIGGSGGTGVLMVRAADTGHWIGPAFYTMGGASFGLQAGASSAQVLMVLQGQKALDSLFSNTVRLGGDVSVALGPKGLGTGVALDADFVVYAKAKGAFAGLAVDGSVLDVRDTLNAAYYGRAVTPVDILVRQTVSRAESAGLQAALADAAR